MDNLKLDELLVGYPGSRKYPLAGGIRAVPLAKACATRDSQNPMNSAS